MDIHRCRFVDYTPHTITSIAFSHRSCALFAPSDLRLAVGRSNGDIEIWNPKFNWTHERTLPGSRDCSVEGLCWSLTEDEPEPRLFSIGGSSYITEWDLGSCKPLKNYDCNAGVIWSIDVSQDQKKLAVGCDDGTVVIVDIAGGRGSIEHSLMCQRQNLRVLSTKWYNNEFVVGGCADGRLRCWSSTGELKGRLVGTMRVDKSKTESTLVWSVLTLPKKGQIVSGDSTGSIKFWDMENFTLLQSFHFHDADVLTLSSSSNEEKIFSAGVDRKIHQFDLLVKKNKISKWGHSFNRLLHSNDVRAIEVYESKLYKFLISGGAERSIVIQSVEHFHDGKYRKLSLSQQRPNMITNIKKNMIVMWQDQTIKIWRTLKDEINGHKNKLVAKLLLADNENITSVSLNELASLMVVARLTSLKVFGLSENTKSPHRLKVIKFRDTEFGELIEGADNIMFYEEDKFVAHTPDDEVIKFVIDTEQQRVYSNGQIDFSESDSTKNYKLAYTDSINRMCISRNGTQLAVSRFNGIIETAMLKDSDSSSQILTNLSSIPHLITFSNNDTLIVLTDENKLYEFNVKPMSKDGLITLWSKRNSEFLPKQFLTLEDKPQGIFTSLSPSSQKVWIYGSTWLSFFDMSVNIPINKDFQNVTGSSKKRNRDGLTIDIVNGENDEEVSLDGSMNIIEDSLGDSFKQSQVERLRQEFGDEDSSSKIPNGNGATKPFWLTSKYRPIIFANNFGDDGIVVIERPSFALPSTPSFHLPKLQI